MSITKTITVKIEIPEGYEDCHPEIIFHDFVENPKLWKAELAEDVLTTKENVPK